MPGGRKREWMPVYNCVESKLVVEVVSWKKRREWSGRWHIYCVESSEVVEVAGWKKKGVK